uniref:Lambda-crystallin homolog n=1 Tax=Caenorhabditis tropicalis TaxID=1561998 RepID=A0A1I7TKM5_9PELO
MSSEKAVGKIAIVGSGLVGSSWATIFASSGYKVQMYDISEKQLQTALTLVEKNLRKLDEHGLQRGNISADAALLNVSTTTSLEEVMKGAIYVQESALEDVNFRIEFYKKLDSITEPNTILASSTSTIPASKFTEGLVNRERCLIVHPVNPPLFLPLTEIVPAPWTSQETIDKAAKIMESIKQKPVKLKKEVLGFAVNRLQFALLAEAWRLVADDVIGVNDVDLVMSAGLGPRYAFNGPCETVHLNAFGVRDYFRRYGSGATTVLNDMGIVPDFTDESVIQKFETELEPKMSSSNIREYQAEREVKLVEMAKLKKAMNL